MFVLNFATISFTIVLSFLVIIFTGDAVLSQLAGIMSEADQNKLRMNGMFRPI